MSNYVHEALRQYIHDIYYDPTRGGANGTKTLRYLWTRIQNTHYFSWRCRIDPPPRVYTMEYLHGAQSLMVYRINTTGRAYEIKTWKFDSLRRYLPKRGTPETRTT